MRIRKVRGGRRKFKEIEQWKNESLLLSDYWIKEYNYQSADIVVHPWCDISILNCKIPSPYGKCRALIIEGLIEIYKSWKVQLDKLGKPYYLKIWLRDSRIEKSEVVCAFNERIEWYENVFTKAKKNGQPGPVHFGSVANKLNEFNWDLHLDEETYDDSDLAEPHQYESMEDYYYSVRWFKKIKKKARIVEGVYSNGNPYKNYKVKMGNLWVGELTNP
ncbi:MAG: hypothetical protein M0D57_08005 [Sphingobacteriales bacterium JAD_PAG50586_3]|nr:MAG: hypothetical protein M0D57_08005 [Sphingobacteriales bacterium JAD_PAG50586_3]